MDISLKSGSLEKMKITTSKSKDYVVISGKELITSLGLKTNVRSNKNKKARYAINNVIMKYLLSMIKEFEKLLYKDYVRKRTKHEPTDSYFYIARQLTKCMMIPDAFNFNVNPVRTEMTGRQHIMISHVCDSE